MFGVTFSTWSRGFNCLRNSLCFCKPPSGENIFRKIFFENFFWKIFVRKTFFEKYFSKDIFSKNIFRKTFFEKYFSKKNLFTFYQDSVLNSTASYRPLFATSVQFAFQRRRRICGAGIATLLHL